jgi:hypothetical protein
MTSRAFRPRLAQALIAGVLLVGAATAPLSAQGGLVQRLGNAARGAQSMAAEIAMAQTATVDMEGRGLNTVAVGPLAFGVSGIAIRDSVGIRVVGYLHNPTEADVSIPLPARELFVLVDSRGRRIEALSAPRIAGLPRGAQEVRVPAMERVALSILFGAPAVDAGTGMLKVGSAGMIRGLPTSEAGSEAAPAGAGAAGANPWTSSGSAQTSPAPAEPARVPDAR